MSDSINGMFCRSWTGSEKIRIAFLLQDATLWPAWESLFYACALDKRFEARIFLVPKAEFTYDSVSKAQDFLDGARIPYTQFSPSAFEMFSPHAALLQTPYDYLGREPYLYSYHLKNMGIRVLYVPYGIEIVDTPSARHDHFRSPVVRNAWRIYTMSNAFANEYRKYCPNFAAVRALGLPRFDALLQRERFGLSDSLKARIGDRRVVVWHTHFTKVSWMDNANRQITPYLEEYVEFAKALPGYKNLFFIFLPHPKFGNDAADPVSNRKSAEVLSLIQSAENAFVDREDDYRPSLLNANAIITDRSSLMVESAITDVPVLLLENPDYCEQILPPLVSLMNSFYHGTGKDDMLSFIDRLDLDIDERKLQRSEALKDCVPCLDGKCAERIKEDIYQSMLAESSCNTSSPVARGKIRIILFGTGFMYKTITRFFSFPEYCEIIALSDNDSAKWGQSDGGIQIVPPSEINNLEFDKIIIMINNVPGEHVYRQLRFDLEIPENKIEFCDYLGLL